ncbi:IS5 family transposase [Streptomyces sp. NPDC090046]|uniref:IS5 family transposase n=1 Tax=Streptomyces sp. NPDC090046 TaxID=3365928 RepID=UPI00382E7A40
MGRGDLTDAEWERLRLFLPVSNGRCGRWRDHRHVIDGILHRVRTRVQWRDLPERFGTWETIYERHLLWSADGTWEPVLRQVQATADAAGETAWDSSVDSTIVRAHQHAAGAPIGPASTSASKGGFRGRTPDRNRGKALPLVWRRWCCRGGTGPVTGRVHQPEKTDSSIGRWPLPNDTRYVYLGTATAAALTVRLRT